MMAFDLRNKYVDRGFNLVPLRSRDKIPAVAELSEYFGRMSRHDELENWFGSGKDYNVGIITGSISNLIVIDIDGDEAKRTFQAVAAALSSNLQEAIKSTMSVRTGGGGAHLYFKTDKPINHKKLWVGEGHNEVAIKGEGGYVVAPPSIHPSGKPYELVNDVYPVFLAAEQIRELAAAFGVKERKYTAPQTSDNIGHTTLTPEKTKKLFDLILPHYTNGKRNYLALALSGYLRKNGVPKENVLQLVELIANKSEDAEKESRLLSVHRTYDKDVSEIQGYTALKDLLPSGVLASLNSLFLGEAGSPLDSPLNGKNSSEAEKRAFLTTEIMNRLTLKTLDDTNEILYYENGVYHKGAEARIVAEIQKIGGYEITNTIRGEVLAAIRALTYVLRNEFDNHPGWVHVDNGWINYDTKEFKENTPHMLSLRKIPHKYDSHATNSEQLEFFSEIFEEGDLDAVQKFFGYLLLPDNRYKKAFMAVGPKDTGKSKFLELVEAFAGVNAYPDNVSHVSLHDMAAFNHTVADITKSIVNTTSELPKYQLKDVSLFKGITGGDERTFREIYGKPYKAKVRAKFLMATNDLPSFDDMDRTFIERWVVFRFSNVFKAGEDMDINIIEKLTTPEEMSGLLNYALEGLSKLIADGYFKNEDYETLKSKWETISSKIADYKDQHCVCGEDKSIAADVLYQDYCQKTENPLSNAMFGRELKKAGVIHKRVRNGSKLTWTYFGLTTKEEAKQDRLVPGVPGNLGALCSNESSVLEENVLEENVPVFHGTPRTEFQNTTIQCPRCQTGVISEEELERHALLGHPGEPVMAEYEAKKGGAMA